MMSKNKLHVSCLTGTCHQNAESIQIQHVQSIWKDTQRGKQAHKKMLSVLGPRDGRRRHLTPCDHRVATTPSDHTLGGTGMDGMLSRRAWVCPGAAQRSSIFTVPHDVTLCS